MSPRCAYSLWRTSTLAIFWFSRGKREDWLWEKVSESPLEQGLGLDLVWFSAQFRCMVLGLLRHGAWRKGICTSPLFFKAFSAEVENWFLAAQKGHPLICAWRDLYNAGWEAAESRHDYVLQPMFRDVDLSHIAIEEHRDWLLMHVCFKKLIDEDQRLRRLWTEMSLLKADEGALAWMAEVDASRPEEKTFVGLTSKL